MTFPALWLLSLGLLRSHTDHPGAWVWLPAALWILRWSPHPTAPLATLTLGWAASQLASLPAHRGRLMAATGALLLGPLALPLALVLAPRAAHAWWGSAPWIVLAALGAHLAPETSLQLGVATLALAGLLALALPAHHSGWALHPLRLGWIALAWGLGAPGLAAAFAVAGSAAWLARSAATDALREGGARVGAPGWLGRNPWLATWWWVGTAGCVGWPPAAAWATTLAAVWSCWRGLEVVGCGVAGWALAATGVAFARWARHGWADGALEEPAVGTFRSTLWAGLWGGIVILGGLAPSPWLEVWLR